MPTRLIEARVNAGLTVAEAAKAIGVDRRTLAKAEAGEYVREGLAKRIAEHWGFQPTDIWPVRDNVWDELERRAS